VVVVPADGDDEAAGAEQGDEVGPVGGWGSGCASDAATGRGKRCDPLQIDGATTGRAQDHLSGFQLHARDDECVEVLARLSEECDRLCPFVRDGRTFRVMLVICGDQFGGLDDGRDDMLQGLDLTSRPLLLRAHARQHALRVSRAHPFRLAVQRSPRKRCQCEWMLPDLDGHTSVTGAEANAGST
jgi:hypothetical protein